jgi:hypothetical protein
MIKLKAKLAKWSDGWVVAFFGVGMVLRRWRYGVVFGVIVVGFAWLMSLVAAGDTDIRLLFSGARGVEKMGVVAGVFWRIFGFDFDKLLMALMAVVEGIVVTLLVFVWRRKQKVAREAENAGVGAALALVGTGCAGCGTSLLAPMMGAIFSSGGYMMASILGWVVTLAALIIGFVTIRRLGMEAYVVIKSERRRRRHGTDH